MPQSPAAMPIARPAAMNIAALTVAGGLPATSCANAGTAIMPITGSNPNIATNFFMFFSSLLVPPGGGYRLPWEAAGLTLVGDDAIAIKPRRKINGRGTLPAQYTQRAKS